jgi:predicted helicase
MAYVTNAGWVDGNAADGLRACLAEEFSDLYIFHLRGNQRTSGELSRREGGKVFGSGSRAPIAISIFVKNPQSQKNGNIRFHDIGDYLDQKAKLAIIRNFGSVAGITEADGWVYIEPDEHSDWLKQRDTSFEGFIAIGDKKDKLSPKIFENFSHGTMTSRDAWCFNSSKATVAEKIESLIEYYEVERQRLSSISDRSRVKDLVGRDPMSISWSRALLNSIEREKIINFDADRIVRSLYRPFTKQFVYFDKQLNEMPSLSDRMFPSEAHENLVICTTGAGESQPFSALMTNALTEYKTHYNGKNFPLYWYEKSEKSTAVDLFQQGIVSGEYDRKDGIADDGLKHFQSAYPSETITKEDLFYYVYGLLHSEDYRSQYADNLSKELPRIPCVKKPEDFWVFSRAGRALGELHVKYESVDPYPITIKQGDLRTAVIKDPEAFYRVTKMKFGGNARDKDKSTVIYNANITMQDIPLEAYEYVVNGKPALEWVMERQVVKTDKTSGIVNDANRYAIETVGNPAYPLELFQRVITVSLETMKIVRSLPKLEVEG